jgi:hypothetical protein
MFDAAILLKRTHLVKLLTQKYKAERKELYDA